jgi:UDP-N-acetyl-D-galactosamine dehydrogenase
MGMFVANKLVKLLAVKGHAIKDTKVLVLGVTFKENCPDIRNTRVVDVVEELQSFGLDVDIYDSLASNEEVKHEYNLNLVDEIKGDYKAIMLAVAHDDFKNLDWDSLIKEDTAVFDLKGFLPKDKVTSRL